ncbi:MAG: hypothetical protein JWL83_1572 [Actinomycetia bacterium]|jgi:hypothetical protein|nr:hypothetical protein [Actinomycetes bacterium]
MTRRLPHGGTTRPQFARPGNGYGRRVKAGPPEEWRLPDKFRTDWSDLLLKVVLGDAERVNS